MIAMCNFQTVKFSAIMYLIHLNFIYSSVFFEGAHGQNLRTTCEDYSLRNAGLKFLRAGGLPPMHKTCFGKNNCFHFIRVYSVILSEHGIKINLLIFRV